MLSMQLIITLRPATPSAGAVSKITTAAAETWEELALIEQHHGYPRRNATVNNTAETVALTMARVTRLDAAVSKLVDGKHLGIWPSSAKWLSTHFAEYQGELRLT